jgi:hypothetical protein
MNSSEFSFNNINDFLRKMQEETDKINNPNGSNKTVVHLDNFKSGTLRIFRQMIPDCQPLEVNRINFIEGNRLSLDGNFCGIIVGESKDLTKKFEIEFVGYSAIQIENFKKREKLVNRK